MLHSYICRVPKILLTDHLHPLLKTGLEENGFTVDDQPDITEQQVHEIIHQYDGLVINSKVYAGEELFSKAPYLKFVCRAGSGLEVMDLEAAAKRNIECFNSPEGNRQAVAEHALGLLLNALNNISRAHIQVKEGQWIREPNRGTELHGKTVALLGYGNTAQAFAKVLMGFDVSILAYDKYKTGFGNQFVQEADLPLIFEKADVLSIHLPLTAETTHIVNSDFLRQFKKPIWLINTARGKNVNTADLITALEEHRIIAAGLDVLENEKLETLKAEEKAQLHTLAHHPRVVITPHIAGWTHESKRKIAEVLLEKILALYA